MAKDPQIDQPPVTPDSVAATKPDKQDGPGSGIGDDGYAGIDQVDKKYWLDCLEDAERAEQDWRRRGREIIQLYRNETRNSRNNRWVAGSITFNVLYANTEVMLPAIYQRPPQPVVRSRFQSNVSVSVAFARSRRALACPLCSTGGSDTTDMRTRRPSG